jgi:hypothetical protein
MTSTLPHAPEKRTHLPGSPSPSLPQSPAGGGNITPGDAADPGKPPRRLGDSGEETAPDSPVDDPRYGACGARLEPGQAQRLQAEMSGFDEDDGLGEGDDGEQGDRIGDDDELDDFDEIDEEDFDDDFDDDFEEELEDEYEIEIEDEISAEFGLGPDRDDEEEELDDLESLADDLDELDDDDDDLKD